jgi:hypothetical protein
MRNKIGKGTAKTGAEKGEAGRKPQKFGVAKPSPEANGSSPRHSDAIHFGTSEKLSFFSETC